MLTWLKIHLKKKEDRLKSILLTQGVHTLEHSPPLKFENKKSKLADYFLHLKPPEPRLISRYLSKCNIIIVIHTRSYIIT